MGARMTDAQAFAILREIETNARAMALLRLRGIEVEVEPDRSWTLVIRRADWEQSNGRETQN